MGTLSERIKGDLKQALKARDQTAIRTLRLLASELHNAEIEKRVSCLPDEEVRRVISREVKRRQDAVASYRAGGRAEKAADEEAEAAILSAYLPAPLGDAELTKVIAEAIQQSGATGERDIGKVMGAVMGRVRGQAEGARVRDLVTRILKGSTP